MSAQGAVKRDCDQCQYQDTTQSFLKIHYLPVHEGITYYYGQCQYMFTSKCSLKTYKLIAFYHLNYKCDQCQDMDRYQDNLKLHKQAFHKGVI